MLYSRREIGKLALAVPAAALMPGFAQGKPDSKWGGVQVGLIAPHAFQGTAPTADAILSNLVALGISAVELQNDPVEAYAGAPATGGGGGRGRGRGQATPEQQAEQRARAEELKAWRLSVPMDKYTAFRKQYNDAGVSIYGFKLTLTEGMSDAEHDYAFNVTKALGADQLTMELPGSATLSRRIGESAAKHKVKVGYHQHLQATFNLWDEALTQSPYNGINLDIGHYVAGTSQSPIPLIEKHHERITSIHLKDRKKDKGDNMPWGQGDTPIREVLQLMKARKYTFPATIELEYRVEGSDPMAELRKCVQYCREALGG